MSKNLKLTRMSSFFHPVGPSMLQVEPEMENTTTKMEMEQEILDETSTGKCVGHKIFCVKFDLMHETSSLQIGSWADPEESIGLLKNRKS